MKISAPKSKIQHDGGQAQHTIRYPVGEVKSPQIHGSTVRKRVASARARTKAWVFGAQERHQLVRAPKHGSLVHKGDIS